MVDDLSFLVEDDAGLREIFTSSKTIAVIGLSSDPMRPSFDVASYLQRNGYRIVPVNPNETDVLGVPSVPNLGAIEGTIDVVDVFKHPERALDDGILMTPALVRFSPTPVRSMIGALGNADAVLLAMGMDRATS